MPRSTRTRWKRESIYSKGEVNRIIDSLFHPLFDFFPALTIADTIFHGLIEQSPPETALKFLRYNLPRIIEELTKNMKRRTYLP